MDMNEKVQEEIEKSVDCALAAERALASKDRAEAMSKLLDTIAHTGKAIAMATGLRFPVNVVGALAQNVAVYAKALELADFNDFDGALACSYGTSS